MALNLKPILETIGIEATSIDLAASPDSAEVASLRAAFAECSVPVVRKQQLSPETILRAIRHFGELFEQHNKRFSLPECPQFTTSGIKSGSPTVSATFLVRGITPNHSNDEAPPKATVLHAVELEDRKNKSPFPR